MNAQEIFNKVATHLLTQNAQSKSGFGNSGPGCRYRNPEGLACAAGCLLTDEEAALADGLGNWVQVVMSVAIDVSRYDDHTNLIQTLQSVHDRNSPHDWVKALAGVAEDHALATEVLGGALG